MSDPNFLRSNGPGLRRKHARDERGRFADRGNARPPIDYHRSRQYRYGARNNPVKSASVAQNAILDSRCGPQTRVATRSRHARQRSRIHPRVPLASRRISGTGGRMPVVDVVRVGLFHARSEPHGLASLGPSPA